MYVFSSLNLLLVSVSVCSFVKFSVWPSMLVLVPVCSMTGVSFVRSVPTGRFSLIVRFS